MDEEQTRQRRIQAIAAEEEAKFCDTRFGQLDWAGCPNVKPSQEEEFAEHDKYGFNNIVRERPLSLGRRLNELLEEATEDPRLANELSTMGVDVPGRPHKFFAGEWDVTLTYRGHNKWRVEAENRETAQQEIFMLAGIPVDNRDAAISNAGNHLQKLSGPQLRRLTEQDQRELALHASQDCQGALGSYISRRLPIADKQRWENSDTYDQAMRYISDPRWAGLVWEALWFCWINARADYADTPERRAFIERHIGNRMPTVGLLDQAWAACQEQERRAPQSDTVRKTDEEEPVPDDLNDLSDEEVSKLMTASLQLRGRRIAQARRGL